MRQLRWCLVSLTFSLIPACLSANPWVQPEGRGIAILNGFYYSTAHSFDSDGQKTKQPRFTKYELNPYVEYGLNENWTLGASLFLQALSQESQNQGSSENWGLGNSELFACYQLYRAGRSAVSIEPFYALPARYGRIGEPRAGREDSDVGMALNAGRSFLFYHQEHFAALRMGYRHRLGELGDQLHLEARAGLRMNERWMLMPELLWTLPVGALDSARQSVAGQNDYDLKKGQFSVVYSLNEASSIQAGIFRHLAGEDTGAGGGALLSLWHRF